MEKADKFKYSIELKGMEEKPDGTVEFDEGVMVLQTFKSLKVEALRVWLPYGKWVCDGGREVLFNRDYSPIWQKTNGGNPSLADMGEWVENIIETIHYYGDSTAPWLNDQTLKNCLDKLGEFGVSDERYIPHNFIPDN